MLTSRHPRAAEAELVLAPDLRAAADGGDKDAKKAWKQFEAGLAALAAGSSSKAVESFDACIKVGVAKRFVDGHFAVAVALLADGQADQATASLAGLAQTIPQATLDDLTDDNPAAADPLIGLLARVFNNLAVGFVRQDPKAIERGNKMITAALGYDPSLEEAIANQKLLKGKKVDPAKLAVAGWRAYELPAGLPDPHEVGEIVEDAPSVYEEIAAAKDAKSRRATASYLAASEAFDRGAYAIAIQGYGDALKARPDFIDARYNLAVAHLARGEAAEALPELERVISESPEHAPALGNAGAACAMLDDKKRAIDFFRRALAIDPTLEFAKDNLAQLEKKKRR